MSKLKELLVPKEWFLIKEGETTTQWLYRITGRSIPDHVYSVVGEEVEMSSGCRYLAQNDPTQKGRRFLNLASEDSTIDNSFYNVVFFSIQKSAFKTANKVVDNLNEELNSSEFKNLYGTGVSLSISLRILNYNTISGLKKLVSEVNALPARSETLHGANLRNSMARNFSELRERHLGSGIPVMLEFTWDITPELAKTMYREFNVTKEEAIKFIDFSRKFKISCSGNKDMSRKAKSLKENISKLSTIFEESDAKKQEMLDMFKRILSESAIKQTEFYLKLSEMSNSNYRLFCKTLPFRNIYHTIETALGEYNANSVIKLTVQDFVVLLPFIKDSFKKSGVEVNYDVFSYLNIDKELFNIMQDFRSFSSLKEDLNKLNSIDFEFCKSEETSIELYTIKAITKSLLIAKGTKGYGHVLLDLLISCRDVSSFKSLRDTANQYAMVGMIDERSVNTADEGEARTPIVPPTVEGRSWYDARRASRIAPPRFGLYSDQVFSNEDAPTRRESSRGIDPISSEMEQIASRILDQGTTEERAPSYEVANNSQPELDSTSFTVPIDLLDDDGL